ncbi:MAG TPA: bifunctional 5,10-methylenetetrahydrofolate dehydrogenase/5,10-methenyltetrahydrofolate cyclohydrolase [Patescibacteria group bacterium]
MKLIGKDIADKVYQALQKRVTVLKKQNINPHLVVFLIGENPASVAYVRQKQMKGEEIGCKVTILRYNEAVTTEELEQKVKDLNEDPSVHAILIQRPVPEHVDISKLELLTSSQKDVDGFHPDSPYTFPIPLAVMKILEEVFETENAGVTRVEDSVEFLVWLQSKNIVIVGKGPTGGAAIIKYFKTLNLPYTLVDSKTPNPKEIFGQADIIISAVGRANIIKAADLKPGVILVGVGIFRGADGKLQGDYNENEIENIAGYYTPTPGGVGPVNVAMLFANVLTAAERQTKEK